MKAVSVDAYWDTVEHDEALHRAIGWSRKHVVSNNSAGSVAYRNQVQEPGSVVVMMAYIRCRDPLIGIIRRAFLLMRDIWFILDAQYSRCLLHSDQ